jgi:hypothetical protein
VKAHVTAIIAVIAALILTVSVAAYPPIIAWVLLTILLVPIIVAIFAVGVWLYMTVLEWMEGKP